MCLVEQQIDALPAPEALAAMTVEEQNAVYDQLQTVTEAYYALTEQQQGQVRNLGTMIALHEAFSAMTAADTTAYLSQGECGDNLTYTLSEDGTLTITGTGRMDSWTNFSGTPWYEYQEQITEVVIGDGVTRIGMNAFAYCSMVSVSIPDSVTEIEEKAFLSCENLTSVTLPQRLTVVRNETFHFCTSLETVILPEGLTHILSYAFSNCESLTEIVLPESLEKIYDRAFFECTSLKEIILPDGLISIGDRAFAFCDVLENVYIPANLTKIPEYAFAYCDLKSLTIPDTITYIGLCAFADNDALTSVVIPDSVTYLGDSAFRECDNLDFVQLPQSLTEIYSYVFYSCDRLSRMTIPNTVTYIGAYAFYETGLTSVTLPSGLTGIGEGAFSNMPDLTRITFTGNAPTIHGKAFSNITVTAYYPPLTLGWEEVMLKTYGDNSNVTWVAMAYGDHVPSVDVILKEPTCTETGLREPRYCLICGEALESDIQTIPALDHNLHIIGTVYPTCTEDGYTGDEACVYCGVIFTPGYVISKLGHNPITQEIPASEPTDTEYGNTAFTVDVCQHCGLWINADGNEMTPSEELALWALYRVYAAPRSVTVTTAAGEPVPAVLDPADWPQGLELKATVTPATARQEIKWTSSSKSVATVENGVVKPIKSGNVTITAAAADNARVKAAAKIKFVTYVRDITITGGSIVAGGKALTLKAAVTPANATSKAVSWRVESSISGVKIANGRLTTPKVTQPVTIAVFAEAKDGNGAERMHIVTIYPAAETVTISGSQDVLSVKKSLMLTAAVAPDNASQNVTWKSSNNKIATVENGVVKPVKPGTVTITATAADGTGKKASVKIKVVRFVEDITITGGSVIAGGKALTLKAAVTPADATTKTVTWGIEGNPEGFKIRNGKLTTPKVTEKTTVTVWAQAKDGSGVKKTLDIDVYPAAEAVTLDQTGNLFMAADSQLELKATVAPETAYPGVTWKSSNAKIATVKDGLVTPVKAGNVTITATAADGSGKKATVKIKIVPAATELNLTASRYEIPMGMDAQLTATVNKNAILDAKFLSSDPNVAVVDENLWVIPVGPGATVITAANYNGVSASVTITVTPAPTKVALNAETLTLGVKETFQVTPRMDSSSEALTSLTSDHPAIVSVSDTGLLTAKKAGKTTIRAKTFNGLEATMTVTVLKAPTSVTLTHTALTLSPGQSAKLEGTVTAGAAGSITYTSNNEAVASVDASGRVTANRKGTATITAKTYNGRKVTCTVTVTDPAYTIHDLWKENGTIKAAVTNAEACKLVAELVNEDTGEVFLTLDQDLQPEKAQETMILALPYEPEGYFLLRARLVDAEEKPLCGDYICRLYTSDYERMINASPEDYPEAQVLDFEEFGFGVLEEGVIRVPGSSCTFTPTQPILPGDCLILTDTNEPVKVGKVIYNVDGTITVQRDPNAVLTDFYQKLNIHAQIGPDTTVGSAARGLDDPDIPEVHQNITIGPVTAAVDVKLLMTVEQNLDKDTDFHYVNFRIDSSGTISGTLKEAFDSTKEWVDNPLSFPVVAKEFEIGKSGLKLDASLLKLEVNLITEAAGGFDIVVLERHGFRWDSESGFHPDAFIDNTAHLKVEGNATVWAGPRMDIGLSFWEYFKASLSGDIALRAEGTVEETTDKDRDLIAIKQDALSYHACDGCASIKFDVFAGLEANLEYNFSKNVHGTLFGVSVKPPLAELGEAYFSFDNEPQSILQGEAKFGFGSCPNHRYRVEFQTVNRADEMIEGMTVTLLGDNLTWKDDTVHTSTAIDYLHPGDYTAQTVFDAGPAEEKFTITNTEEQVRLEEPEVDLYVYVWDGKVGDPISGAEVRVTGPEGTSLDGYTGQNGSCEWMALPVGTYTFHVTAENYEPYELTTELRGSCYVNIDLTAKPAPLPVVCATAMGSEADSSYPAKPIDGSVLPDNAPLITIAVEREYPEITAFTISYEGCAPITSEEIGGGIGAADVVYVYGVDMGDDQLTLFVQATWYFRGSRCAILRPENGKLTVVKTFFDGDNNSDGIDVKGTFTNETDVTGTIYPSGRTFSAVCQPVSGTTRTGKPLFNQFSGYLNYQELDDGSYGITYTTEELCGGDWDLIGRSQTLYVLRNGEVVMDSQWFTSPQYEIINH